MCKVALNVTVENGCKDDEAYEKLLRSFQAHFDSLLITVDVPKLFMTNAHGLWDAFVNNIDVKYRQHYTCRCCKNFIEKFGGLVFISRDGSIIPAVWADDVPKLFQASVKAVVDIVKKSVVTDVFITDQKILGTPKTGEWEHFYIELPTDMVKKSYLFSSSQIMAAAKEDFKALMNGLTTFSPNHINTAIRILKAGTLSRSDKFLEIARWLKSVHDRRNDAVDSKKKTNVTWLSAVTAPSGFCHVKSSMIGTLLEDIANGLDFETIKERFEMKVDPERYMRAQSAPSEANIKRAEEIFEKLGIGSALERRFARLDEVKTLWKPREQEKSLNKTKGLFSHLKSKETIYRSESNELNLPPKRITWDKFSRTVLPEAESIELSVSFASDLFSGILTAEHNDARPIIQWDNENNRNPFSHYLYYTSTTANSWNLIPGWVKVTGICYQPSMWQEGFEHHGKGVFFLLEDCKDTRYENGYAHGNSLFPEILISELHEVRKTIEAYAETAPLMGYENASACGIRLQEGVDWDVMVRVTSSDGYKTDYSLDRWD